VANPARLGNRVDAGLLIACVGLSFIAIVLRDQDREPIASALRRTVVAPLVGLQRGAERWRVAYVTNDARQMAVDSVVMRTMNSQALQVENDQLRRILGLGSRLEWGFVPADALRGTAPSEQLVTTLTLTAGSTAGVTRYSPVVAPEGLVGTIQTADPTMSIAILYTNPDFRASAMAVDGSTFGIIYPHAQRGSGSDAYMLEMRGVPTKIQLKPGTTIYTSGLGGTFPRGITIGTIVVELKTSEVWTRTYLVRPAVTPSQVTTVLILTPKRISQGTGNIWGAASAMNADSASKRIATAGDSLAKRAAAADARARATALDSLRQAAVDSALRSLGMSVPNRARPDSVKSRPPPDSVRRP
jgi:rod shape-determining protein MreC